MPQVGGGGVADVSALSTILPQQVAPQQHWLAGAPGARQPSLEAPASSSYGSAMDTAGDNNEGAVGRNGMAQRKRVKDVRADSGPAPKIPRTRSEVRAPVHSNTPVQGQWPGCFRSQVHPRGSEKSGVDAGVDVACSVAVRH
jgi:hypothetical protein